MNDPRLQEISGLAAVENGYLAINDSHPDPSVMRIDASDAAKSAQLKRPRRLIG